ncbi:MAG TPA: HAMP domain-containing sensor histidine kinase [Arachidicoccus sp.]|nr:HAMP domain-containing sensor histidine kinase [Arachidicoccus sp.]
MKLLNYTSIRYLLFTALLLLLSIPVFYFVLNKVFIQAIDNDLYQQAKEIPVRQDAIQSERGLRLWRKLDNDLEIVSAGGHLLHPKPYTEMRFNNAENDQEGYRILEKRISMLGKDYIVRIKSSLIEKEYLIQTILSIQLSLFFLLLFGAATINYFISKRIWQPFYKNLAFLQSFKLENEVPQTTIKSRILEFDQLHTSIQQFALSVHKAYTAQKEFTENASHELQTPIAVLKSKLELLLQESGLSEAQSILMDDMNKVIVQLEGLNRDLLFLSKIENNQYFLNEPIDVEEIVLEVAGDLYFMIDARNLKLQIDFAEEKALLEGNRHLFKAMIINLFRNAIQYSPIGSLLSIKGDLNRVLLQNPGEPLLLSPDQLFHRFAGAGSWKGAGNGLGLAIAKKIADIHQLKLTYEYKEGWHAFEIRW